MVAIDRSGEEFGTLIVIDKIMIEGKTHWNCLCKSCGDVRPYVNYKIGKIKSCYNCRDLSTPQLIYGGSTFSTAVGVKTYECRSGNGRGIHVADEWMHDPKSFVEYIEMIWDEYLEEYPEAHYGKEKGDVSIDRIDNDLGYVPGNIGFATQSEQNLNR